MPAAKLLSEGPQRERFSWYKLWDTLIEPMPRDVWRRVKVDCGASYARLRLGYVARAKKANKQFTTRVENGKLFVMMKSNENIRPAGRKGAR